MLGSVEPFTTRAAQLPGSPILALMEDAKRLMAGGADIINLSGGEPDLPSPPQALAALAAQQGQPLVARYSPVAGRAELREAIARHLSRSGLPTTADQILVTNGAKHALATSLLAGCGEGEEVIVPSPYWVSYIPLVHLCGARPVIVRTRPENGFKLTPDALAEGLTSRSRWLILNTPNNPTGAVYTRTELEALLEVVRAHPRVLVLSDEVYDAFVYDNAGHVSPAMIESSRVVVCNSFSKSFAMAGWRLGYLRAHQGFLSLTATLQSHLTSGVCTLAQDAALAALSSVPDYPELLRQHFESRREIVLTALRGVPHLNATSPAGGLCTWLDAGGLVGRRSASGRLIENDAALADALLHEVGVAVVPGSSFGWPGHLRMALADTSDRLLTAVERLATFATNSRPGK